MVDKHFVEGFEDFMKFVKDFKAEEKVVNILFTGKKDEKGVSWCPDCNEAEPFIEDALDKYGEGTVLITVEVGDRTFWKDINNPFRKDKDCHLSVIPTLVRWKHQQRLEGEQLLKPELLQMFFADEDD
ncbi:CLUMA_CG016468, isoform A [Clunio marinus]|uniref:Thioredoxin domain-containing protein 17 n=1 Tax=Clunio marinus TaxID=568069 RepID=A0A1J1IS04_9DIPT|nr:CLUMA_CG016468, isoform A [Clunio marinus]